MDTTNSESRNLSIGTCDHWGTTTEATYYGASLLEATTMMLEDLHPNNWECSCIHSPEIIAARRISQRYERVDRGHEGEIAELWIFSLAHIG